jgi:hypothetical protein
MDIIALTTLHTVIADGASSGVSTVDIIAWIGIPLFIAIVTAVIGIVKGSIRFAQYMAHSEESSDSIAKTNGDISATLSAFIARTDAHLSLHDQEIAVIKYALGPNGNPAKSARLRDEMETSKHRASREDDD